MRGGMEGWGWNFGRGRGLVGGSLGGVEVWGVGWRIEGVGGWVEV